MKPICATAACHTITADRTRDWGPSVGRLKPIATGIDRLNQTLGSAVAWLTLIMVVVQFTIVVMRYVFGVGYIYMQESIVYMHGILFLLGAGFTLLHNGHVRVDLIYREASVRRKALTDLLGSLLLLIPVMILILWAAYPYVQISWSVLEGSKETSGIPGIYLLKTTILIFAGLMLLQGISMAIHAALVLMGVEDAPAEEPQTAL